MEKGVKCQRKLISTSKRHVKPVKHVKPNSSISQTFRVRGAPTKKANKKSLVSKKDPTSNINFGYVGEHLIIKQGAFLVPRRVVGNHYTVS